MTISYQPKQYSHSLQKEQLHPPIITSKLPHKIYLQNKPILPSGHTFPATNHTHYDITLYTMFPSFVDEGPQTDYLLEAAKNIAQELCDVVIIPRPIFTYLQHPSLGLAEPDLAANVWSKIATLPIPPHFQEHRDNHVNYLKLEVLHSFRRQI